MPRPRLDPVLEFMRLLWNVEHGLQSASKRMEATLGVTGPQRLVLLMVTDRPGVSAGELAHALHLHPSTITGIVQRLAGKGLLRRERDRADGRRVRLRACRPARPLVAASRGTVEDAVTRALGKVPARHVGRARDVLAALADALAHPHRPGTDGVAQRRVLTPAIGGPRRR